MNSFNTWIHILHEFNDLNRWIHRMYEFICMNSLIFCSTNRWIHTYEFVHSMNSSIQNKWIHLIVVRMNSFILWIHLYKIHEFTYLLYVWIHLFCKFICTKKKNHLIVVRGKPKLWACSANCEGESWATRAKPEHTPCPNQATPGCPDR